MALATNTSPGEIRLAGDLAGSNDGLNPELSSTGITAGEYTIPTVTVDSKGRVTAIASNVNITPTIDDATTASKGIVQIDGTYLDVTGGVLTVDVAAVVGTIADATTVSKGIVQIDGTYLDVTGGVLTVDVAAVTANLADATTASKGIVQIDGTYLDVTTGVLTVDVAAVTANLADATTASKGIVQIDGNGLDVTAGVLSIQIAESASLGIVKSADVNNITITAGDVNIGPNVALKNTQTTWTAAQNSALNTLSYASSIAVNASLSNIFQVTLTGSATLANPTNLVSGAHYTFFVKQDATGGRTLGFGSSFKFKNGHSNAISTNANDVNIICCISDGTNLYCTVAKEFV